MDRKAYEFAEKLDGLTDPARVVDELGVALKQVGIDNYLLTFAATPTETFEDIIVANRTPAGLREAFNERGYLHDDDGFRYAQTAVRPFRWFAPYDERQPRTAEIVRFYHDFGLVDGIVVPFDCSSHRRGQIWFGAVAEIELPAYQFPALHLMANFAFDRVLCLKGEPRAPQLKLSPRELEVLKLISAGLTNEAIAARLFITHRTVVAHVQNCFRKLGAANRAQALMIAVRDRIIQP